jgi:dUTP pyrophosphatase
LIELPIELLRDVSLMPEKAHDGDAGFDLLSVEEKDLRPGEVTMVSTGVAIAIPEGYCGLILPRSSMGKRGIIIPNSPGLIDSGYRGEIKVLLLNLSKEIYRVYLDNKIAQLVIVKYENVNAIEVPKLPESQDGRGVGGFGSSGK